MAAALSAALPAVLAEHERPSHESQVEPEEAAEMVEEAEEEDGETGG